MVLRLGMPLVGGVEETLDGLSIILRETGATLVVVDAQHILRFGIGLFGQVEIEGLVAADIDSGGAVVVVIGNHLNPV